MIERGKLQNFKELVGTGTSSVLTSTILPLSATAWTTFMTGVNPGKHGIYDFARRVEGTYKHIPVGASDRGVQTFWSLASEAGKRCCIVNVPLTYPPEPVNGAMVSGFPYPEEKRDYCYPEGLLQELQSALPSVHFHKPSPHFLRQGEEEKLVTELLAVTRNQVAALRYLLKKERWDLVVTVFDATDVASHFLWRHIDPKNPRYKEKTAKVLGPLLYEVYEEMDRALGEVRRSIAPQDDLIVLSDHGFGPVYHAVYMNNWLLERKYLSLKKTWGTRFRRQLFRVGVTTGTLFGAAKALRLVGSRTYAYSRKSLALSLASKFSLSLDDIDWEGTKVYAFGNYGQFFVNTRGREPSGKVKPGEEVNSVVSELEAGLAALKDSGTGRTIFDQTYRRQDIYSGRFVEEAPDLVFLDSSMTYRAHRMFEFGSRKLIAPDPIYSGSHRMEGIFIAKGPSFTGGKERDGFHILDLAPTILHMMGLPVPRTMDGKVLQEAFAADSAAYSRDVAYSSRPSSGEIRSSVGRISSKRRI